MTDHYDRRLFEQQTPYLQWLREEKAKDDAKADKAGQTEKQIKILSYAVQQKQFVSQVKNAMENAEILLFVKEEGYPDEHLAEHFAKFLKRYPTADIVYADEDYLAALQQAYDYDREENETAKAYQFRDTRLYRCFPWFKPEYSPDTLLSFFYFGNVTAIRSSVLQKVEWLEDEVALLTLYDAVLQIVEMTSEIYHLPKVLYTNPHLWQKDILCGAQTQYDKIKYRALQRRKMQGELAKEAIQLDKRIEDEEKSAKDRINTKISQIHYNIPKGTTVSIIIPSKNNSKVLQRCLETLTTLTEYQDYEIIIVDNGSNEAQRTEVEALGKEIPFTYLYEEREFNFSIMCNCGAARAKGEYLLFLNDDMEVIESSWLTRMLGQAVQPHVGAVGAKLYYPKPEEEKAETPYRIQHAGITNMAIGPAHKLGGMEDTGVLYHGHNLLTYDMLGVTAACLLVKKERFYQVGGFAPELSVAYNDVDFCFALYEAGYYNVVRNDAVLLHCESLSRGQDITVKKQERLAREKALLYQRHPALKEKDPFYSRQLVQWKKDAAYTCNYLYPYDKIVKVLPLTEDEKKKLPHTHHNKWLKKLYRENLSMLEIDSLDRMDGIIRICGWHVWQKHDNGQLAKKLLLRHIESGQVYEAEAYPQLRKDVEALFSEDAATRRAALSGFQVLLSADRLIPGSYRIGMLASGPSKWRLKMICWSDKTVWL